MSRIRLFIAVLITFLVAALAATAGAQGSMAVAMQQATAAGFSAIAANTTSNTLANNGNLGRGVKDTFSGSGLKSLAATTVTAGATGGLASEFGIGLDARTLKPVNTTDLANRAKYAAVNTTTKTAADIAILGKPAGEALLDNLLQDVGNQVQAAGSSHLGHAYQNQDLSYLEHKLAHAAIGGGAGAITGTPMAGAVGGFVGEVTAEALIKSRATDLLDQMLERKITPEQLQAGLEKLRSDASDVSKLSGATTAFVSGLDINATTTSAGNAAENNAVSPLDAVFIGADLVKIGAAYYQDDQALMEEAIKDLAVDIIPGVPAGTSRLTRLMASGAKSAYKTDKLKDVTPNVKHLDEATEVARPTAKQSEVDVGKDLGALAESQKSFKGQDASKYGAKGSVRPDFCIGNLCSIEVKNYDINKNSSKLVDNVAKQAIKRSQELPQGMVQEVWIDVRGQKYNEAQLESIKVKIEKQSKGLITKNNVKIKDR